MCLYPRIIRNKKYTETKKNGGIIPPFNDNRVLYVPVGCGTCIECRKQKARGWQVRLLEDLKDYRNGKFITLTFSNQSIKELTEIIIKEGEERGQKEILTGYDMDNEIATKAMRLFLERWRKKYTKSLRHWMVTEIGHNGTENIHLHGIVWTNEPLTEVRNIWKYGYVWIGKEINGKIQNYVNERTVNYIVKYIHKVDEKNKTFRSKVLTSAGIGGGYTNKVSSNSNKFKGEKTIETYRTSTGHNIAMPVYWRNKIYSDEEREKLWIIKLNKEERWVRGERVDISKGDEEYYKLLDWHRQVNAQLGYGKGKESWGRKIYENERREILRATRIKNASGGV